MAVSSGGKSEQVRPASVRRCRESLPQLVTPDQSVSSRSQAIELLQRAHVGSLSRAHFGPLTGADPTSPTWIIAKQPTSRQYLPPSTINNDIHTTPSPLAATHSGRATFPQKRWDIVLTASSTAVGGIEQQNARVTGRDKAFRTGSIYVWSKATIAVLAVYRTTPSRILSGSSRPSVVVR
jgi:hypothetical protein